MMPAGFLTFNLENLDMKPLMSTNSNGCMGYLPSREAFPLEGYEIARAVKHTTYSAIFENLQTTT